MPQRVLHLGKDGQILCVISAKVSDIFLMKPEKLVHPIQNTGT